ncbi:type II toxin-antitoxin system VapC family toxin [Pirellulimonas nuda]
MTDAQIASIAIAHNATVHTADHDFRRFNGLKTFYPLG